MQGLWEEAAGKVLLQGGCSAQGGYVCQLHLGALVLSPFPHDPTKHILMLCHTVCIAASVNKGGETRTALRLASFELYPLWLMDRSSWLM